jgi:hypothetical protein
VVSTGLKARHEIFGANHHQAWSSDATAGRPGSNQENHTTMNSSLRLDSDACLMIFDPHQDVAWVRSVVERERPHVSHLLLGGDYFDTFKPSQMGTVEQTCDLLLDLAEEWGDRLTVLLGNHDIPYLEAKCWFDRGGAPPGIRYHASGFDYDAAKLIAQLLPLEFWAGCRLFQCVNGWLVSHGGLAGIYWYPHLSEAEALAALDEHCKIALERIAECAMPILQSGRFRGGDREIGGITWLDFDFEFLDGEVPLRQIVGHTPSARGARPKGRSWCLDGGQSCYGILRANGDLEVRNQPK